MTTEEFNNTINQLIELGEDPKELLFWQTIYPDLNEIEKKKLDKNLEDELKQLKTL